MAFNKLIFSSDMIDFLEKTSGNKVSMLLLHGRSSIISEEGNFIDRDATEKDILSYIPKSKYKRVEDQNPYVDDFGRVRIKIGRFVRKFLSKQTIIEGVFKENKQYYKTI